MIHDRRWTAGAAMVLATCTLLCLSSVSGCTQAAATYTQDQANAGQTAYEQACAACHLSTLQGAFEAPALAGPNFLNRWGGNPVRELFQYMRASMPPTGPPLGDDTYTHIIAFILQQNGFAPGTRALLTSADTPLGAGMRDLAVRPRSPDLPGAPDAPRVTVPALSWRGEVPDYRPVTNEMLRNPPPGDWLMFRRTYDGWGYSPLDEITTQNVGDLELAWVWAMADGSNQPTPLVHDGIMYLTNPGNIIQALDARTGDVIWQYAREVPEGVSQTGFNQLRNISIYEDKVLLSTKDAALVALDARTGDVVWEHQIADPALGYSNVSGPLVTEGTTDLETFHRVGPPGHSPRSTRPSGSA